MMPLKDYLRQAGMLNISIEANIRQAEFLRKLAQTPGSFICKELNSEEQSGEKQKRARELITKLNTLEAVINGKTDRYVDVCAGITELLSRLRDPFANTVLTDHYVVGMTWEEVAEKNFISVRNCYYINNNALEELAPIYYSKQTA